MKTLSLFILIILNSFLAIPQVNSLNGGTNGIVEFCYSDLSNLIVGGSFTEAGGATLNCIATWNGSNWGPFGNNPTFSNFASIKTITKYNGNYIIAGKFDSINSIPVNNIVLWDGLNWQALGDGFNSGVYALEVYNGELYAGGTFTESGSTFTSGLAKWTGSSWVGITDFWGTTTSFTLFNNKLVVAGYFSIPDGGNVASFDGTNWDTSLSKLNDFVYRTRIINDTLYACGEFTSSPLSSANFLAAYYNSSWNSLPLPVNVSQAVTDIAEFNNDKYICGYFTGPEDIGRYNEITNTYDSVISVPGFVRSFTIHSNQLFFTGWYSLIDSTHSLSNIASISTTTEIFEIPSYNIALIFRNPSIAGYIPFKTNIVGGFTLYIYDLDGRFIAQYYGHNEIFIYLNRGVYVLHCIQESYSLSSKLVVL